MAQTEQNNGQALLFTLALHVGFIGLAWLASVWVFPVNEQASQGEPVQASLSISEDDLAAAKKAIRSAELAEASALQAQPIAEPRPQTSLQKLQQKAQAWIDQPDKTEQDEVNRTALLPSDQKLEQQLKQKQGQVELTEDVLKDTAEENRQRLLKQQLDAVKKQRAALQADINEAQKLDDLAAGAGKKSPERAPNSVPAGQAGPDEALRNRYTAAINATARANWNTAQVPQQTRCQVEFTQIRPGVVTDVDFLVCALDANGRDSVERALVKSPMPYSGFEQVFQRKVILTFCYPDEVCQ